MAKKKHDGWCAKTKDGKWISKTLSDLKADAEDELQDRLFFSEIEQLGAKIVKVKLVEVK